MPQTEFSDPRVQRILDSRDVAVLSTVQPDGAPLAMAMWFVHDVHRITMISVDGLQKAKNMRRDPRVCVVVESLVDGSSRCASIQGHVEFVETADERRPLVDQFFRKYPDSLERRWNGRDMPSDRVMFQILPRKVFYWGQP